MRNRSYVATFVTGFVAGQVVVNVIARRSRCSAYVTVSVAVVGVAVLLDRAFICHDAPRALCPVIVRVIVGPREIVQALENVAHSSVKRSLCRHRNVEGVGLVTDRIILDVRPLTVIATYGIQRRRNVSAFEGHCVGGALRESQSRFVPTYRKIIGLTSIVHVKRIRVIVLAVPVVVCEDVREFRLIIKSTAGRKQEGCCTEKFSNENVVFHNSIRVSCITARKECSGFILFRAGDACVNRIIYN